MFPIKPAFAVLGAVALTSFLGGDVHGASSLHTNRLTFPVAVALPGVTLTPGTYVFEQVDASSPDVVVVRNARMNQVYFLGFTTRTYRPAGMNPEQVVTLGEAARGVPPRIKAWYPKNEDRGYEFAYPR